MAQKTDATQHEGASPEQEAELARQASAQEAETEEGGEQLPEYSDDRHPNRSIINTIANKRRRAMEEEIGADLGSSETETETGEGAGADAAEGAEQPATRETPQAEPEAGAADTGQTGEQDAAQADTGDQQAPADTGGLDPNTPVPIKVYGEVKEIPLWQMQRDYQIAQAGHAKLQEANRRLAQAQEMEAQLQNQQQAAPAQGQQPQQPAVGADDQPIGQPNQQERQQAATDEDEALQLANALQFGDTQEAAEAIRKLKQTGRGQGDTATPDTEQITQQVTQQMREQMQQENLRQMFAQEYPELAQEQYLADWTNREADQLKRWALSEIGYPQDQVAQAPAQQVHQVWRQEQQKQLVPDDTLLLRAAGDNVRQKLSRVTGGQSGQQGAQQPPQQQGGQAQQPAAGGNARQQKREAKRKQAAPTTGQNAAASLEEPGPQLQSGESPQDAVQWLKKQRGQL